MQHQSDNRQAALADCKNPIWRETCNPVRGGFLRIVICQQVLMPQVQVQVQVPKSQVRVQVQVMRPQVQSTSTSTTNLYSSTTRVQVQVPSTTCLSVPLANCLVDTSTPVPKCPDTSAPV